VARGPETTTRPIGLRQYARDYLFVLGPRARRLPAILALMLLQSGLDLVGVGLVAPIVAALMGGELARQLPGGLAPSFGALGAALVVVFALEAVVAYRLTLRVARFGEHQRAELMGRLLEAYQAQGWEFHLQQRSSELVNRVLSYTQLYGSGTLVASLRLGTEAMVCGALVLLLAWTDVRSLLLLGALFGGTFAILHHVIRRPLEGAARESVAAHGRILAGLRRGLGAYREAHVLGTTAHFRGAVGADARLLAEASARRQALGTLPRHVLQVVLVAAMVLVAAVAGGAGPGDAAPGIAIPTLGTFAVAALRMLPAANGVLGSVNSMRTTRFALELLACDLRQLGSRLSPAEPEPKAPSPPERFSRLRLAGVTYAYPDAPRPALRELDLTLEAGESVGLDGASGAGKSTLADVLLGFLEPQQGRVELDGQPIVDDLPGYWSRVAYIPQDALLLDDSIARNVAFGLPESELDPERLRWALCAAQLGEVIDALPAGVETLLGEAGVGLSGGQRQRVALARALYHDRQLIVLDEATSALDDDTERAIVDAILALPPSTTLLLIAHRESTLSACGRRLRMEAGKVEEVPVLGFARRAV